MKKRYCIVFLLISEFFPVGLKGQSLDQTFQLAQTEAVTGQYELAIALFQRVLFFSDGPYRDKSFLALAECYSHIKESDKALMFYDLAYDNAVSDSLANEILFKKAALKLLESRFMQALSDLFSITPIRQSDSLRLNLYLASSYFGIKDFERARSYFFGCIPPGDSSSGVQIDALFQRNEKYHRLNPKAAKIMSIIVPGSGQLYSGHIKEGLNSLLLTGGLAWLTFNTITRLSYLDAMLSVFPWFYRYYSGGLSNAGELANERIREHESEIYHALLEVIARANQ